MKTREQMKQERREGRAVWIVSMAIITVWIACLLCSTANAAYDLADMSKSEAVAGATFLTWIFMRVVIWLDKPGRRDK